MGVTNLIFEEEEKIKFASRYIERIWGCNGFSQEFIDEEGNEFAGRERERNWNSDQRHSQEKMIQGPSSGFLQEAESRQIPFHSGIKVVMKGYCIGRIVDLRCVDSYEDLLSKLEDMFDIEGQLCGPTNKWIVAYIDDENDLMMLGDLPWHEFCAVAWKIVIYPTNKAKKEEVNTTLCL